MNEREQPVENLFLTNDYSVEVTLAGKDFDPVKASQLLGKEPTKSGRCGEPRHLHQESDACWKESFWSYEISSRDDIHECRDHHISCLIDDIQPHMEALKEAGMERVYFYYTLASSIGLLNIKLAPATMRRLSEIEANLYISCFDCFNPNHAFWKEDIAEGI
ncbi:MAG: DUF4279 domain-containing protein [Chlorobi bacterium]|nr:DUF4279 domain-containing protein [Chlorobiota bacterium]